MTKKIGALCTLCKKRRTLAKNPALPGYLYEALQSCKHRLFIPGVSDPICVSCQQFYAQHLREHDPRRTISMRPSVERL